MTTSNEHKVVFPQSLRDMFPADAQKLYIETYEQSFAAFKVEGSSDLSRESVAARDAWDTVKRAFQEDPITHKWRRAGEQAAQEQTRTEKRSLLDMLKRVFQRA